MLLYQQSFHLCWARVAIGCATYIVEHLRYVGRNIPPHLAQCEDAGQYDCHYCPS